MKSIKPGRGPSMMRGIVGVFMIGFGILWTLMAAQAGGFFALFGVLWTGIAVVQTVYNFKNATSKNRHSSFDITEHDEEPDPFNEMFGSSDISVEDVYLDENAQAGENAYCPYCGSPVQPAFRFCNVCGKELP